MTFTSNEIRLAGLAMARAAFIKCPARLSDFLTQSQADALIDEMAVSAKDSLMFSLQNYIEESDEP